MNSDVGPGPAGGTPKRGRKVLFALALFALLFAAFPRVAALAVERAASKRLGRRVTISRVAYAFPLRIEGVFVEGGASRSTLQADAVTVELAGLQPTAVRLERPTLSLARAAPPGKGGGAEGSSGCSAVGPLAMSVEDGRLHVLGSAPVLDAHVAKASLSLSRDAACRLQLDGEAKLDDVRLTHDAVAESSVRIPALDVAVKGATRSGDELGVEKLTLTVGAMHAELSGRAQALADSTRRSIDVTVKLAAASCADVITSLPEGFAPRLRSLKVEGQLEPTTLHLVFDAQRPKATVLEGEDFTRNCRITAAPPELDVSRLATGDVTYRIERASGEQVTRTLTAASIDYVPLAKLDPWIANVFIASEDPDFVKNIGLSPTGLRIALTEDLRTGRFARGASTLAMQLVRTVVLSSRAKTLSRKVEEVALAIQLVRTVPRERILELYLNAVEFAPGVDGLGVASALYFEKPAAELTLPEAAFLASALPNPRAALKDFCAARVSEPIAKRIKGVLGFALDKMPPPLRMFPDRLSTTKPAAERDLPVRFPHAAPRTDGRCSGASAANLEGTP